MVVVAFLGFAVWPTPYRYLTVGGQIVRINRMTGTAFELTTAGWYKLATPQPQPLYDEWKRAHPSVDTGMKTDTTPPRTTGTSR